MKQRLAQTIGLFLLLGLFGERTIASSPPASPQDRPAPAQDTGETDRRNQEEETDPSAQEDDTDILLTDEGDIIYTEIDVTGTVIRETPIDSPNSVSIIDRIDVLKEGAGAVYGSDAIAGVVNFITRGQFEGFEVSASYDHYSSSKDGMLGGIWGKKIGTSAHVVVAMEHKRGGHIGAEETGWALRPYPGWWWGWSGTGIIPWISKWRPSSTTVWNCGPESRRPAT